MKKHVLHLHPTPFMRLLSGKRTIESRLNDEKRQLIKVGDTITFINRLDDYKVEAEVVAIIHATNFRQLFNQVDHGKLGDTSPEELLEELEEFYTAEQQSQYGVVGIEIKVRG